MIQRSLLSIFLLFLGLTILAQSSLTNGLLAYYPFNGNATDMSGNGHHGTVNSASLVNDRFGNTGSAFEFDGVQDYIEIPNSNNAFSLTRWTLAAWVKPASSENTVAQPIIYKLAQGANEDNYGLYGRLTFATGLERASDGMDFGLRSDTPTELDSWQYVVGTYDGNELRLYINGSLDSAFAIGNHTPYMGPTALRIGSNENSNHGNIGSYDGCIDEVRIYNRSLSASEISQLYDQTLEQGLLAYYPFSGNANDVSGNDLHGLNVGATLANDRFNNPESAYAFDGIDDYIDIPASNGGSKFTAYTVNTWINLSSIPQNQDRYYFYYNETSDGKLSLYIDPGGFVYVAHHDGTTWQQLRSSTAIRVGDWYQVGITWDGQDLVLYLNGYQEDQRPLTFLEVQDIGAAIGRQDYWYDTNLNNRGLFHGRIDDVIIYNRALSSSEILDLFGEGSISGCTDITDLPASGEATSAAACLCELGYVEPKNYGGNNTNGVEPDSVLYRADLAKLLYYTLYKNGDVSNNPALNFPTPFYDLEAQIFQDQQNSDDPSYYNYGKILSYLEYGDGITPFDRNFLNFNPYQTIQRRYALKALLETLNIAPEESGPSPFPAEINPGDDSYGYVKKAFDMGLITQGNVTSPVLRGDFFVILHRLIQSRGDGSCTLNYTTPAVSDASYFLPGNLRPDGLSRAIGMTEGYFTHAEKPVFNIPGFNMPLQFQIFHNSYLTELPENARRLAPLGMGWSHSFNAYIVEESSLDASGAIAADKLFVFWPGGNIHQYDQPDPNAPGLQRSESIGVFDQIEPITGGFRITKKNQVKYIFTEYTVSDGSGVQRIWMLTEIIDRNQNAIVLAVEEVAGGMPRITSVTGTSGSRRLLFTYKQGTNQLVSVEDKAGNREVAFQYNQSGKLQYYTNPRGYQVQYFYGSGRERHLLRTIRLPRGTEIEVTYDQNLKLASVKYPGMTNPLSVQVSPNYNTADQYSAAVQHPDFNIETTYQFTEQYNQLAAQAIGQTGVLTTYNADNLPETIVYGEAVYDGNGYLTDINDPVVTQVAYDNWGNVIQLIEALGATEQIQHSFTYTPIHDIATYTDPRNFTTEFVYDNGNINYIDDNMNYRTDYTVNNRGLVEIVDNPELISTDYDYDAFGNLTSVNLPLDISQTINYDAVGRPIQVKNPLEQITAYAYDEHNQVKLVTRFGEQENITLGYNYDPNDNLIDIENAKGNKTVFSYYPDKELLQSVTFGDDATSYTYLDDYRLDYYTKPDGTQMNISYDNQGRIISDGYVDTYTYDARSNVKTVVKDGLTTSFNYDALDRIDNYTDIYGQVVNYTYDPNGNTTQITYPGGFVVTYEYDANNRLQFTRWDNGTKEVAYTYLKDGRLDRVDYPNGTYCTYAYDAAGRMTEMVTLKSNTTDTICAYTFELDKLGNHLAEYKTEPLGGPAIPMLSAAGTYNDENEVQTYNGESFQFDANGNQTQRAGGAATWDNNDMLLSYGANQYTYDGLGKLRRALRNGQATRYVWDIRGMGNVLVETDDSGTPLFYYIHGLGLVARINAATNAVYYYHYDFRGSTVAMTDDTEAITHSYSYLPYGELAQQQEADPNPFKFVGRWGVMAEGNNLYYMRARFYDAPTGRFLSEDPVWGDNLYRYGENNPINMLDPLGDQSADVAIWNKYVSIDSGVHNAGMSGIEKTLATLFENLGLSIGGEAGWRIYAYSSNVLGYVGKILTIAELGYDAFLNPKYGNKVGSADAYYDAYWEMKTILDGLNKDLKMISASYRNSNDPYERDQIRENFREVLMIRNKVKDFLNDYKEALSNAFDK